jgi:hypothetical protein
MGIRTRGLTSRPRWSWASDAHGDRVLDLEPIVPRWRLGSTQHTSQSPHCRAPLIDDLFTQGRFVGVGQMQDEVNGADHYRKSASRYAELAKTAQDPVLRDIYLETVRYMMLRAAGPAAQS